jgi:hypothetical protein
MKLEFVIQWRKAEIRHQLCSKYSKPALTTNFLQVPLTKHSQNIIFKKSIEILKTFYFDGFGA